MNQTEKIWSAGGILIKNNELLKKLSKTIDEKDFMDRAKLLGSLGETVLISNYKEYYRLVEYFSLYTKKKIGLCMGVNNLVQIFDPKYYTHLSGGILEAFGKLFFKSLKVYLYPVLDEKNEINKIEDLVNDMVSKASDVRTRVMTPKEAVDNGALALFGEKYGDEVRVLSMGEEKDKYFSTELCGGTHVSNTSEIGRFKIISQSSISSGVRRVEALRADQLVEYEKNLKQTQSTKENKLNEEITTIKKALEELKIKPNYICIVPESEAETSGYETCHTV